MEERRTELKPEEREGGQFVLSKTDTSGAVQEMVLSEMEVMFLSRLAPSVARQLSANKSRTDQGISALVPVPVRNFSIGSDLHQQIVILRLLDDAEQPFDFSLAPSQAQNIAVSLTYWGEKIGEARSQTRQ
jgi:hypothetical protein